MQILSNGDNLHEISNPVFCENKKNIIRLSSAELTHRVVKTGLRFPQNSYNIFLQASIVVTRLRRNAPSLFKLDAQHKKGPLRHVGYEG